MSASALLSGHHGHHANLCRPWTTGLCRPSHALTCRSHRALCRQPLQRRSHTSVCLQGSKTSSTVAVKNDLLGELHAALRTGPSAPATLHRSAWLLNFTFSAVTTTELSSEGAMCRLYHPGTTASTLWHHCWGCPAAVSGLGSSWRLHAQCSTVSLAGSIGRCAEVSCLSEWAYLMKCSCALACTTSNRGSCSSWLQKLSRHTQRNVKRW